MEESNLKDLLGSNGRTPQRRGWRCPDTAQLAAYVDCRLEGAGRSHMEAHLSDCDFCLAQVSFLARSADWPEPAAVPPQLLIKAKNLVSEKPGTTIVWGWRWAAATALAACLLLAIGLVVVRQLLKPEASRNSDSPLIAQKQPEDRTAPVPQTSPAPSAQSSASPRNSAPPARNTSPKGRVQPPAAPVRGAEVNGLSPKLLFPQSGAVLRRSELEFRWQPISDAIFYEVFVVTAAGDLVVEKRSEDARLTLSADVPLVSGSKYFVWVRAHFREGKTAKSEVVSFRVRD